MQKNSSKMIFEVSWEVCNKVGGIHTVITTKYEQIAKYYPENYFFVGPYNPSEAPHVFQERQPSFEFQTVFDELREIGIDCHYGIWDIDGSPSTILVDTSNFRHKTNDIKTELWDKYQIDSLGTSFYDFDEPILWGYSIGLLISKISSTNTLDVVAHFHEWISGSGVLYLNSHDPSVKTVFTTHATTLGRSLSSHNIDLYNLLEELDPEEEAKKYGVTAKHQTETQCASHANIFTTVSNITGKECEFFLHKAPDIITPNGLNFELIPNGDELKTSEAIIREKIEKFIYYSLPYGTLNSLDETKIFYTAGRNEFDNKGIDITLDALAQLDLKLKNENNQKQLVFLVLVPSGNYSANLQLINRKTTFEEIKKYYEQKNGKKLSVRDIQQLLDGNNVEIKDKFPDFFKNSYNGFTTHDIENPDNDIIFTRIRELGLDNNANNNVKVIYCPVYLNGRDGLIDINYDEIITGTDMGVFPSFYEPWGYTPLEAAAYAIPVITSNTAGFGQYVSEKAKTVPGISIIDRWNNSKSENAATIASIFYDYLHKTNEEYDTHRNGSRELAELADWKEMVKRYDEAYSGEDR